MSIIRFAFPALALAAGLGAAPQALAASASASTSAAPPASANCCAIVELRRYVTYPGTRDTLVRLFEDRFIESQEALGIRVIAQFRDLNEPDHFTWVRGFSDMEARRKALTDFYLGSPVWQANRNAANATLYDNDDVLLLHPAAPGSGFAYDPARRAPPGATAAPDSFVVAQVYSFAQPVAAEFTEFFDRELMPLFERHGAQVLARLVTDKSRNTFERLPVREDVNVYVWFARFANRAAYDSYRAQLGEDTRWRGELFARLRKQLQRPPEVLMLTPTARSQLR
ncbi:NIPSNAP family containing protein [Massilia arenosa]|uniref:NIPSNAP family containing protein n=1 Tax=Zemynaea arenosa TaxID=2561931 RepID=A0A4Y9SHM3_9BURK|nr:NIPSNAP family protein [Massilia arenosa]TFW21224.1 NIPSNAP family containing protein [Massilia arenosa]